MGQRKEAFRSPVREISFQKIQSRSTPALLTASYVEAHTKGTHLEGWLNMTKCVTGWRILGQGWLNRCGNSPWTDGRWSHLTPKQWPQRTEHPTMGKGTYWKEGVDKGPFKLGFQSLRIRRFDFERWQGYRDTKEIKQKAETTAVMIQKKKKPNLFFKTPLEFSLTGARRSILQRQAGHCSPSEPAALSITQGNLYEDSMLWISVCSWALQLQF